MTKDLIPVTATTDRYNAHSATSGVAIHPLLADRWSPRAFDPTPVPSDEIVAVLEAARWAPSAMNAQPWRFIVGQVTPTGADLTYTGIYESLMPGNQAWAGKAPVLIAAVARVEEDGGPRASGTYELGLAVAQLTLQAHSMGLHVHQMGGFNADEVATTFGVPSDHLVVAVLALGRIGDPNLLPDWAKERESSPRERLPLAELAFSDAWGNPLAA